MPRTSQQKTDGKQGGNLGAGTFPPDSADKGLAASLPRPRILAAALHCFAAKGFHGTSMQEICAEASMSPGALYRYFPSKDAIIAAIAEQERENNRKFFQKLEVTENILETLMDTGFAWMRDVKAREGAALCTEVLAEAHRNPRIREIFERNHEEARAALRATLERAQQCGEVEKTLDLDVAVTVFLALGDGLLARAPLDPHMAPERVEPGLRILMKRMLRPAGHAGAASTPRPTPYPSLSQPPEGHSR
jgi:TetR/AcrR family transcriptional regulator, repressor for uid operon